MAYRDLPFVGVISADSIVKENFIIAGGNFASASNQIADFNVSSGDENLLRVGQTIYSVGGVVPTNAVITNIDGSLITMDVTASAAAVGDTIGISTPSGSYLFQSASFTDPRGELNAGSITGSNDDPDARFAVLGVAKRNGSTRPGAFHLYNVSEVVYDNVGSAELSFFVEWGEEGTEADSGDILQTSETTMVILDKTASGSLAAGMSRETTGLENIVAGSETAGYNLAITQYLSDLSGSIGGSSTTATGSFTGSFTGSILGDVIGTASIADFATTASYISTASFADSATTSSIADELSQLATASFADRSTTASIADELSQLATASYALYAISASHEIVHETSSSLAETASLAISLSPEATASQADNSTTASFAETGDGIFSGSFSGSFQGDGTNLTGVASPTGSYTGSFTGSFLGDVIGTASIADTASFFDGTVVSASHAETSSIRYDSGSSTITGLDEIKINDFDDNVGVTFQDSKLTLTFGSPTVPSISSFFNSGFDTNRFNKVEDESTVTANWSNGGYTFVSASILTGSIVLATTVEAGDTNLTLAQDTSGSQRYTLIYTGSSPLDGSEYKLSNTVTSTLSKSNPNAPSISDTVTIQLGDSSNQFEQGATGSIAFSSAYGSSNGWDQVSLVNTPTNTPIEVTGSATGSTSISIQSVASYESPTGENDPQSTTSRTTTRTFSKIRSVRYGASSATSFTQTEIEDLGAWDTTLGGDIGTIDKGNTNPSGDTLTITWSGDKYQYIIYDGNRSDLSGISTSGFGVIGQFTKSTVGDYTVYRTTALQAGGAGSSITYNLT